MRNYYGSFISYLSVFIVFLGVYSYNEYILFYTIIIACILDMFDGKVARMFGDGLKSTQTFGELTDSLCDTFNFAVAPGLLLLIKFQSDFTLLLLLVSFLIFIGSIFRLARFSSTKTSSLVDFYIGLPVTVSGPLFSFLCLFTSNQILILIYSVIISYLMVCKIKVKKLKLGE